MQRGTKYLGASGNTVRVCSWRKRDVAAGQKSQDPSPEMLLGLWSGAFDQGSILREAEGPSALSDPNTQNAKTHLPETNSREAAATQNIQLHGWTSQLNQAFWFMCLHSQKEPFFTWRTFGQVPVILRTGHVNFVSGEVGVDGEAGALRAGGCAVLITTWRILPLSLHVLYASVLGTQ